MDRVRLGRALGYGTRHAAKTVAAVVEAATATPAAGTAAQPTVATHGASGASPRTEEAPVLAPPATPAAAVQPISVAQKAGRHVNPRVVATGTRQLKQSFWKPLATFSGALWLRVTGLFFALLATTMASGAWRDRQTVHSLGELLGSRRLTFFIGFALLFGYFAVSSFVRASLKERRAAAGR